MNQFAILFQSALFCISFAQPQDDRKIHCQIREARVRDRIKETSQTFNNGDVFLYELIDDELEGFSERSFEVGDSSGEYSPEFELAQDNTIVTEDGIAVKFFPWTIQIFTLDGNNIAFYQDLFHLEEFDHEFPVTRVVRGGETMENVTAVKAKENERGEWIFAVVDNNGPRLIFPRRYVRWSQEYEDPDISVSFAIKYEPQGKQMTVEFHRWTAAKTFYAYLDSRPIPEILD